MWTVHSSGEPLLTVTSTPAALRIDLGGNVHAGNITSLQMLRAKELPEAVAVSLMTLTREGPVSLRPRAILGQGHRNSDHVLCSAIVPANLAGPS